MDSNAPTISLPQARKIRETSSFGSFSILPPEIRLMVWEYLIPMEDCNNQYRRNWKAYSWSYYISRLQPERAASLAILRASRQFYGEISPMLYKNRTLTIDIDPAKPWWVAKYLPANTGHFRHVDFSRFKRVGIEISPPNPDDPGQLLSIRHLLLDLICCLVGRNEVLDAEIKGSRSEFNHQALLNTSSQKKRSKCLQEINIAFVQHEHGSWYQGDVPQESCNGICASDLEVLLTIFRYVRARTAKFFLPAKVQDDEDLRDCIADVENIMMLDCAFGEHDHDAWTIAEETGRLLDLDEELDCLQGSTAALLRRERFMFWEVYSLETERLIEWPQFTKTERLIWSDALESRSDDYIAWHLSSEKPDSKDSDDGHICWSTWSSQFPAGIPPKYSREWTQQIVLFASYFA